MEGRDGRSGLCGVEVCVNVAFLRFGFDSDGVGGSGRGLLGCVKYSEVAKFVAGEDQRFGGFGVEA